MSSINIVKFTDAGLQEIVKLLQEAPTKIGMPLLQDIDQQLRAAAQEADKIESEAKSKLKELESKVESFTASAKAGVVHVLDEVKAAL